MSRVTIEDQIAEVLKAWIDSEIDLRRKSFGPGRAPYRERLKRRDSLLHRVAWIIEGALS